MTNSKLIPFIVVLLLFGSLLPALSNASEPTVDPTPLPFPEIEPVQPVQRDPNAFGTLEGELAAEQLQALDRQDPAILEEAEETSRALNQTTGVQNGGFESGNTAWTEASTNGFPLVYEASDPDLTVSPFTGNYLAWLGGANSEQSQLTQFITLPSGTNYALEFRFRISAGQEACNNINTGIGDFAQVFVTLSNGSTTSNWFSMCEEFNNRGWGKGVIPVTGNAGDTVRIDFIATTNSDGVFGSFYVDDIALTFIGFGACEYFDVEPNNTADDLVQQSPLPNCPESFVIGEFPNDVGQNTSSDFFDAYYLIPESNIRLITFLTRIPTGSNYDLFIAGGSENLSLSSQLLGNEVELITAELRANEVYVILVTALENGADSLFDQNYVLGMVQQELTAEEAAEAFRPNVYVPLVKNDPQIILPVAPTPTPVPSPTPVPTVCNVADEEPNNRRSEVTKLMPSCQQIVMRGIFDANEEKLSGNFFDNYLFQVTTRSTVVIDLTNVPAGHNYDLHVTENPVGGLFNDGQLFTTQVENGDAGEGETLTLTLDPGQYHITVENADIDAGLSTQQYQVSVRFQ